MTTVLGNLFTPETARANALKSAQRIRERRLAGEQAIARLAELERLGQAAPPNERAERLADLMTECEAQMKGADGDTKGKLGAAYAKLFAAWQVLTGTKSPGTERGSRRQRPAEVQPLDLAAPTPADLRPLGWEYDGV